MKDHYLLQVFHYSMSLPQSSYHYLNTEYKISVYYVVVSLILYSSLSPSPGCLIFKLDLFFFFFQFWLQRHHWLHLLLGQTASSSWSHGPARWGVVQGQQDCGMPPPICPIRSFSTVCRIFFASPTPATQIIAGCSHHPSVSFPALSTKWFFCSNFLILIDSIILLLLPWFSYRFSCRCLPLSLSDPWTSWSVQILDIYFLRHHIYCQHHSLSEIISHHIPQNYETSSILLLDSS